VGAARRADRAQFIASHKAAPEELVLDIDASDVPLHGAQELSQFHAYYDHHCYLPLYVFCGQAMLACYLRPSKIDTRASCSRFIANQFRLLLAALAYTLMQRLRALALQATALERASAATIRVRLLKIGATLLRNTRRVRVMLASHHPLRELFATAAARLALLSP
jgi:hypothetical protein